MSNNNSQTAGGLCPKCGHEVPAGSKFCNHCGAAIAGANKPPVANQPVSTDNEATEFVGHAAPPPLPTDKDMEHTEIMANDDSTQLVNNGKDIKDTGSDATQLMRDNTDATEFIQSRWQNKAKNPVGASSNQLQSQKPQGKKRSSMPFIIGALALCLIVGAVVWFIGFKHGGHGSGYDDDDDDRERKEVVDSDSVAETEYIVPASAQEAVADTVIESAEDWEFYEPTWQDDTYGDELTAIRNFTRPDLTLLDAHGHIIRMNFYVDDRFIDGWMFDRDGEIIDAFYSLKPNNTRRDERGRIITDNLYSNTLHFNWGPNGLVNNINGKSYYYDSRGQLTSDSEGNTYVDYEYDHYLNWVRRTRIDSNGTPWYERRKIMYSRP